MVETCRVLMRSDPPESFGLGSLFQLGGRKSPGAAEIWHAATFELDRLVVAQFHLRSQARSP